MSAVAVVLRPSALEESLGKALGTLGALIVELAGCRADASFAWLAGCGATSLWPLVTLASELEAMRRVPMHPAHGADVARAVMQLVEGRTPLGDFTRIYAGTREIERRVMTLHVLLASACIRLEWLFESSAERPRHARPAITPPAALRPRTAPFDTPRAHLEGAMRRDQPTPSPRAWPARAGSY